MSDGRRNYQADKEKLEAIDKLVCDETETQYNSDDKLTEIYNILNSENDKDKETLEEIKKNSYGTLLEIAKYVIETRDSRDLINASPIIRILKNAGIGKKP